MMLLLAALLVASVSGQSAPVNTQPAVNAEFQKRLEAYLDLRDALGKKLEPLKITESASELQGSQQALAAALRAARAHAKQGDLIPVPVQEQIRVAIKADMQRRTPATKQAAMVEVPDGPLPGINKNYPDRAALPTVPPLLLARLPRLPDNLQYRFFGRHVVLLDGDTEIVVDYVTDAVPR